ncbi:hypothetical protein GW17_00030582 [Ensete ventricosum]|uniref:Uncharacterized protein n=1 Tax=Ensete ventricosum TaxID=4639 RepID=A0A444E6X0_ENSVE|nr:hypothetical protein B296_00008786 [Ensete ventricosum]RWW06112.1 hypothetical protein GW17_00030582 [Ensete ventricosum]RZS20665.1 hypothetical protein BHM03_00053204 [Ensete ventricosum]
MCSADSSGANAGNPICMPRRSHDVGLQPWGQREEPTRVPGLGKRGWLLRIQTHSCVLHYLGHGIHQVDPSEAGNWVA